MSIKELEAARGTLRRTRPGWGNARPARVGVLAQTWQCGPAPPEPESHGLAAGSRTELWPFSVS